MSFECLVSGFELMRGVDRLFAARPIVPERVSRRNGSKQSLTG